jgi:hypothetical protein
MKNKFNLITVAFFAIFVGLGCSSINPLAEKPVTGGSPSAGAPSASNKSLEDRAIGTAVGEETIGIPECDAAFEKLALELNNPNDGYIAKATKAVVLNKIKESIRTSIEQNKGDKAKLAKDCTMYAEQIEKFKAEEKAK